MWPRLEPEVARNVSPDEAKAILVARAVYEADIAPERWNAELRFAVERTPRGWNVQILRVQHTRINDTDVESFSTGIPTIEMDENWRPLRVVPGL